jgi:hypothetical protein
VLFFTPATGAAFSTRQQSFIAAGIYAPRGACGATSSSAAQVNIYGSLLCDSLSNVGGWAFHYDEAIMKVAGTGEYSVTAWDESPGVLVP